LGDYVFDKPNIAAYESGMADSDRSALQLLWFLAPLAVAAAYVAYLFLWSGLVVNGEFQHNAGYEHSVDIFMAVYAAALIFFAYRARRKWEAALALTLGGVLIGVAVLVVSVAIIDG